MFKALFCFITTFFNGFGNLAQAFESVTAVAAVEGEKLHLTAKLESSAEVRHLTKQLAELDAA